MYLSNTLTLETPTPLLYSSHPKLLIYEQKNPKMSKYPQLSRMLLPKMTVRVGAQHEKKPVDPQ
jgi:hypothetical protein